MLSLFNEYLSLPSNGQENAFDTIEYAKKDSNNRYYVAISTEDISYDIIKNILDDLLNKNEIEEIDQTAYILLTRNIPNNYDNTH